MYREQSRPLQEHPSWTGKTGVPTDASGGLPGGVGVALVTLAVVGGVRVLTEAVVSTDGLVHTLVDICRVNGRHSGECLTLPRSTANGRVLMTPQDFK